MVRFAQTYCPIDYKMILRYEINRSVKTFASSPQFLLYSCVSVLQVFFLGFFLAVNPFISFLIFCRRFFNNYRNVRLTKCKRFINLCLSKRFRNCCFFSESTV